jgi:hypothetical protein
MNPSFLGHPLLVAETELKESCSRKSGAPLFPLTRHTTPSRHVITHHATTSWHSNSLARSILPSVLFQSKMLPSRPSPRAVGGLPPPSSRSRAMRPDREEPGRHNNNNIATADYSSRNAYPRQSPSFSSPTSARERSRSRPRAPDAVREGNSHGTYDRLDQPKQRVSGASSSSVSSASSFLDRMRTGQGVSSSRTSLEEEDEAAKRVRRPPGGTYRRQRITTGEDRSSGGDLIIYFFIRNLYHLIMILRTGAVSLP